MTGQSLTVRSHARQYYTTGFDITEIGVPTEELTGVAGALAMTSVVDAAGVMVFNYVRTPAYRVRLLHINRYIFIISLIPPMSAKRTAAQILILQEIWRHRL